MRKTVITVAAVLALTGAVSTASAERNFWVGAGLSGAFAADFGAGPLGIETGTNSSSTTPWMGGGFNIFYDILYGFAEASIGMTFVDVTPTEKNGDNSVKDDSESMTLLNFGLMGKIPINLGADRWVLFPMAGIEYALCLSYNEKGVKNSAPEELSQVWINGGIGMEIPLPNSLYILDEVYFRWEALYGFGLPSKASTDIAEESPSFYTLSGHRLTIRLGIGFKF